MMKKGYMMPKTIENVKRVNRIVGGGEITVTEACRMVGISAAHYRRVRARVAEGEKK